MSQEERREKGRERCENGDEIDQVNKTRRIYRRLVVIHVTGRRTREVRTVEDMQ